MVKTTHATKIKYDAESDSLAIYYADSKSSKSVENGDIIVDIDYKNQVVGLEFLSATKILSGIAKKELTAEMLQGITSGNLQVKQFGNNIVVTFTIVFADKKLRNLKATAFIPSFGKCTGLSVPLPFSGTKNSSNKSG